MYGGGGRVEKVARVDEVVAGLVKALHQALVDLQVTEDELHRGLRFLTEVGKREEFVLLSDVLGISVLVDRITHGEEAEEAVAGLGGEVGMGGAVGQGTASNVEGPFYLPEAPMLAPPHVLAGDDEPGEVLFVSGTVADATTGDPVSGAVLDVWQAGADGLYSTQDPSRGEFRLRGRMRLGPDGSYEFR